MKEELTGGLDKKSSILITLLFLFVFLSVGATYYRFFVMKDYMIHVQAPCDPMVEKCFIYECDEGAGECTGDPATDVTYYKLLDRSARSMPTCNPTDAMCAAYTCAEGEVGCTISTCDETLAESEGVFCSDPKTYITKALEEQSMSEGNVTGPVADPNQ